MTSVPELGKKLAEAGRLKLRPLCVYGTDTVPPGAVPSHAVDRCIAKAIYSSALHEQMPPVNKAGAPFKSRKIMETRAYVHAYRLSMRR
jgi:hypothetical protein